MKVQKDSGKYWLVDYGDRDVFTCIREAHREGLIPNDRSLNVGCTFFCKYQKGGLYIGRKRENGNGWHDVALLDTSKEDLPVLGKLVSADPSSGIHADRIQF
jgi:hypothetical protein